MEITEARIALRESAEKRLKAYATLTFDNCFVVRNVKVIEGKNGLFVAMPSRKPKVVCDKCRFRNEAGGRHCSQCGAAMEWGSGFGGKESAEAQSHRDIAHPITAEFRQYLQEKVLGAYEEERTKSGETKPPMSKDGEINAV